MVNPEYFWISTKVWTLRKVIFIGKIMTKVDPITLSVVRGALETTQREMTVSLEKTARSSVINLARDYSTSLFNSTPEQTVFIWILS